VYRGREEACEKAGERRLGWALLLSQTLGLMRDISGKEERQRRLCLFAMLPLLLYIAMAYRRGVSMSAANGVKVM